MSQPPYPPPPPGQPGYPPTGYPPAEPPPFQPPPRRGLSPVAIVLMVLAGCGAVALLGVVILAAIMFPVFAQAREAARAANCQSNLKQLSSALLIYSQDYDDQFPPPGSWQDSTLVFYKSGTTERCPSLPQGTSGYAFNRWVTGRRLSSIASLASQPLVFDSSAGQRNAADALQTFAPRHRGKGMVAFADGHVQALATAPPASTALKQRK